MPLVERNADVTLVTLIYRSLRWLDFVMEQVELSKNDTRYRWLVVANDATDEVRRDPRVSVDFRSEAPHLKYPENIGNIYSAWNEGVLNARTERVILLNSDMACSDHAIDALMQSANEPSCGLLVEHGRIPSGMPEYVRDFGTNPENFKRAEFCEYADEIRVTGPRYEPGRLYMPVLLTRQRFLDIGGYPKGNIGGVSGDKLLFKKYTEDGHEWVTCRRSVFAHLQEGETRWP